jgi:hypothetical protein
MGMYHFSVKDISRGKGRSAVACAAYRAGEKLKDYRNQLEQDYTKKVGVELKKIYAPEHAKEELLDRQTLWNKVEEVERRKDSLLAREFEIAFPYQFNAEQREKLLNELCEKIVKRHSVIVDACIHAPHTVSGTDGRNYHAHVMFTGRHIDESGDFAKKKNRDFNKEHSKETVREWREYFADLTNAHLEKNGYDDQVDHRSNRDRGLEFEPTIHEGSFVTDMRRSGKSQETEIGRINDAIIARNEERQALKGLDQEILLSEKLLQSFEREQTPEAKQTTPIDRFQEQYGYERFRNHYENPFNQHTAHFERERDTQAPDFGTLHTMSSRVMVRPAAAEQREHATGVLLQSPSDASMGQQRQATTRERHELHGLSPTDNELAEQERQNKNHEDLTKSKFTPEQQSKIANEVILRYKAAVATESEKLAISSQNDFKLKLEGKAAQIDDVLMKLEHEKADLGKKPLFFTENWNRASGEIESEIARLQQLKRDLGSERARYEPHKHIEQAQKNIDRERPKLKNNFDAAMDYLTRSAEKQRLERLEQARAIGVAEQAKKAQRDQERNERVIQSRHQRPR